jgi:hypothetical protein
MSAVWCQETRSAKFRTSVIPNILRVFVLFSVVLILVYCLLICSCLSQVNVPEGKKRDRRNDLLLIRDGGDSFRVTDKVVYLLHDCLFVSNNRLLKLIWETGITDSKGWRLHYHTKRRVEKIETRHREAFPEAQRFRLLELVLKKRPSKFVDSEENVQRFCCFFGCCLW